MSVGLTDGVGRQALRIASELECRGVYLGSCRMGCILKGCLLFIDIMVAEVWVGRAPSSRFGSVFWRCSKKKETSRRKPKKKTTRSVSADAVRFAYKPRNREGEVTPALLRLSCLLVACK